MQKSGCEQTAVILAAGKGTRMKSPHPKVLFNLCGRHLLEWVVRAVRNAGIGRVIIVVGSSKEEVVEEVERLGAEWVEQSEQLGTGHALRVVTPLLKGKEGDVFVLYGDAPLIRAETLRELGKRHRETSADATLITTFLEDPTGYGRIIRNNKGQIKGIVEELDLKEEERAAKEINSGVYCFKVQSLLKALDGLSTENKKGEYYLTQVVELFNNFGGKVESLPLTDEKELLGVNSQMDLARLSELAFQETLRRLMTEGVTVVSPSSTFVEDGVEIGPGTILYPFTYLSNGVVIGKGCRIGPFVYLKGGSVIKDGATIGPGF